MVPNRAKHLIYSLKTSENSRFFYAFRGYTNRSLYNLIVVTELPSNAKNSTQKSPKTCLTKIFEGLIVLMVVFSKHVWCQPQRKLPDINQLNIV